MNHQYEYPRPALTADCLIFGYNGASLNILLVKRANEPFKDYWALPGGFVHQTEETDACAKRILKEKTGLQKIFIEQLYTFSDPQRDPRGWTISVAYFALINPKQFEIETGRNTTEVQWWQWRELPTLAFDHKEIIKLGIERLKGKVTYQPIGFELVDSYFSFRSLQHLYELILEKKIDKRNFRKKILKTGLLIPKKNQVKKHKNEPDLFRFDKRQYQVLEKTGFQFSVVS